MATASQTIQAEPSPKLRTSRAKASVVGITNCGALCVHICIALTFALVLPCRSPCNGVALGLHLCLNALFFRVSEGDVEGSAFALAPTCCGVRGQMLVSTSTLVSACGCIAWNCIATSRAALNVLQLHLIALQLRNGCRCLAK